MKKLILVSFFIFFFTSCHKYYDGQIEKTNGYIISKQHVESRSEYCYHYGYDPFKGSFRWHWGMDNKPEKFNVLFTFFDDTISYNSRYLYDFQSDTFDILYKKIYKINGTDTIFYKNIIDKLIIKDTLKY